MIFLTPAASPAAHSPNGRGPSSRFRARFAQSLCRPVVATVARTFEGCPFVRAIDLPDVIASPPHSAITSMARPAIPPVAGRASQRIAA